MNNEWTFTIHKNTRFIKLIKKLEGLGILSLENSKKKLVLKESDIFFNLFNIVFYLYANPSQQKNIGFCKTTNRLIIKGECIDFAFLNNKSEKAKELFNILITNEDDQNYENAFNALIAIYLGTLAQLMFIYPNTYIIELGRKTHEIDIILGTEDKKCIIVETTRGFDKESDKIEETYMWHFKKALFRKWMIEKIYNIECRLCYITLKGLTDFVQAEPLPEELSAEIQDNLYEKNPLLDKLREYEKDKLLILNLGTSLKKSFNEQELSNLLKTELIDKLSDLFV